MKKLARHHGKPVNHYIINGGNHSDCSSDSGNSDYNSYSGCSDGDYYHNYTDNGYLGTYEFHPSNLM